MLDELAAERSAQSVEDATASLARAEEAARLAGECGWNTGFGLAQLQIARRQDPRDAERTLLSALAAFRAAGDHAGAILASNNLALVYRHHGQTALAFHYISSAYRLLRDEHRIPAHDHAVLLLNFLSVSFEHAGSDAGLSVAGESIDLCRRNGLDDLLAQTFRTTARALWLRGYDTIALTYLNDALELLGTTGGSRAERATTEATLTGVALDTHRESEAHEHGMRTSELIGDFYDDHERANALITLGIAHARSGSSETARECFASALGLGSSIGADYVRACALTELADLAISRGSTAVGMIDAEHALAIGERCDDPLLMGRAHAALHRGAKAMGDSARALDHLERALRLARDIVGLDGQTRVADLPVQTHLEARGRRQGIYRMALPMKGRTDNTQP
jgi:tetratricopeptide (TPR) repeat protein